MSAHGSDPHPVGEEEPASPVDELGAEVDGLLDEEGRSPLVRVLTTVVATVVLAALVVAALMGVSALMRETRTVETTLDLSGAPQLALRAPQADVTLVATDGDQVQVSAQVRRGLLDTDFAIERTGDVFEVDASCQAWLTPGCGAEVTIEVPRGLPVVLDGGEGAVRADGMQGVLTIATTTGSVDVRDAAVDELAVETTSGAVRAGFTEEPYAVKAATRDGDVRLELPQGDRVYTVDAQSRTGAVDNALGGEGTAGGTGGFLRVRSDGGDVVIATS